MICENSKLTSIRHPVIPELLRAGDFICGYESDVINCYNFPGLRPDFAIRLTATVSSTDKNLPALTHPGRLKINQDKNDRIKNN